MNTITELRKSCPITRLLVDLGKVVLKEGPADWIDMEGLYKICKQKGIQLDGKCPKSDELGTSLRKFFQGQEEVYESGVNAIGYHRRVGWNDVLMVRFYSYDPAHRCSNGRSLDLAEDGLSMGACAD